MDKRTVKEKLVSHNSVNSDLVELFMKSDIRGLRRPQRSDSQYICYTPLLLCLILVIGVSVFALINISVRRLNANDEQKLSLIIEDEYEWNQMTDNSKDNDKQTTSRVPNDNNRSDKLSDNNVKQFCDYVKDSDRIDCNPDQPISEDECLRRGCCWAEKGTLNHNFTKPPIGVPFCYFGNNYVGYRISNIENYKYRTVVTLKRVIQDFNINVVKLEIFEINEYMIR